MYLWTLAAYVGHWPRTTTKTTLRWISRAGHLGSIAKVEIHGWWSRCPSWTSTHFLRTYGRIAWGALDFGFHCWKFLWISSDGLSCRWRFDLVYSVESKKDSPVQVMRFLGLRRGAGSSCFEGWEHAFPLGHFQSTESWWRFVSMAFCREILGFVDDRKWKKS